MTSVEAHYETLLAPIYLWMAGGAEAAFSAGAKDLEGLLGAPGFAVDLGAGFGMHAIPLAARRPSSSCAWETRSLTCPAKKRSGRWPGLSPRALHHAADSWPHSGTTLSCQSAPHGSFRFVATPIASSHASSSPRATRSSSTTYFTKDKKVVGLCASAAIRSFALRQQLSASCSQAMVLARQYGQVREA